MGELNPISVGNVATGVGSGVLNFIGNAAQADYNARLQKELLEHQYNTFIKKAQSVGATPAAIAQGLTGSGSASMPSVTTGNALPDVGANIIGAGSQETEAGRADVQNKVDLLDMSWKPKLWRSELKKNATVAYRDFTQADLNKGLGKYYEQMVKDLVYMRPYNIMNASQGLQKLLAETSEIIERTKNYASERDLMAKQGQFYESSAYNQWNQGYNESLKQIGIDFENWIRLNGWNPSASPWDNLQRLALTSPSDFKKVLGTFNRTVNLMDSYFKQSLGEHYKRNIAIGAGLYGLNNMIGSHKNSKSERFRNYMNGLGALLPY